MKKSHNQKKFISKKTRQKILYEKGVSKSNIREAEISSLTPLKQSNVSARKEKKLFEMIYLRCVLELIYNISRGQFLEL